MASTSKPKLPAQDIAALVAVVQDLADRVAVLTTMLDDLVQEVQWQNNQQSADFQTTHLPLTRLPRDPTSQDWHPKFGHDPPAPPPKPAAIPAQRTGSTSLFD